MLYDNCLFFSSEDQFPNLDDYLAFFDFSHNSKLSGNKSYEVEEELCVSTGSF